MSFKIGEDRNKKYYLASGMILLMVGMSWMLFPVMYGSNLEHNASIDYRSQVKKVDLAALTYEFNSQAPGEYIFDGGGKSTQQGGLVFEEEDGASTQEGILSQGSISGGVDSSSSSKSSAVKVPGVSVGNSTGSGSLKSSGSMSTNSPVSANFGGGGGSYSGYSGSGKLSNMSGSSASSINGEEELSNLVSRHGAGNSSLKSLQYVKKASEQAAVDKGNLAGAKAGAIAAFEGGNVFTKGKLQALAKNAEEKGNDKALLDEMMDDLGGNNSSGAENLGDMSDLASAAKNLSSLPPPSPQQQNAKLTPEEEQKANTGEENSLLMQIVKMVLGAVMGNMGGAVSGAFTGQQ
jgi:hypothetical protein